VTPSKQAVVLDASGVLALLLDEPGAEKVQAHLPSGVLGAVNLAEVLARLHDLGGHQDDPERSVAILELRIEPFTEEQARRAGTFRPLTRAVGLSLGDRACLALAAELGAPALTADRRWAQIADLIGVRVQLIR